MTLAPHWSTDGVDWEAVSERARRFVLDGAEMTVSIYEFEPGGEFPLHRHANEQLTFVLEGEVEMVVGDESRALSKGEAVLIPGELPHQGTAGPDGARVVGVVAPPRNAERQIEFLVKE